MVVVVVVALVAAGPGPGSVHGGSERDRCG